jgi:hypothetical protein
VDSAWEQEKLEARKMPVVNRAEFPALRCVVLAVSFTFSMTLLSCLVMFSHTLQKMHTGEYLIYPLWS